MLALWQAPSNAGSKPANIAAMERAACAASAIGAKIITFPEMFLTGYNIGRSAIHNLAETIEGESVAAIAEISRRHSIAIIFGMPERLGSVVHNSAVAISDGGQIVGVYRKIHLFGDEESKTFAPGNDICVAVVGTLRIGLAICYDVEFPEMGRALAAKAADIICAPTANMMPYVEVPTTVVRARALENGVPMIYANLCGREGSLHYTGMSCIVDAYGRDLARAGDGTVLLTCDLPDTSTHSHYISRQSIDLRADLLTCGNR
ncbi:carbon-nitrogen hydrolase [Rhizobium sp. KVB221]|uniref:Carbon-nitrogen hydrolase n=1 Tax=Rhizobium setariae TaxID=2801340 RepID=A0A937CQE0_9HYPH|nr:nitrilase-related carbon-nitrogen hydrolase [Rhizobium setariae]MBL0374334.1 carbon-nitrogen hydrolase [Rhizobium setariae]